MKFTAAKLTKIQELWEEVDTFLRDRIEDMEKSNDPKNRYSGYDPDGILEKYSIDHNQLIVTYVSDDSSKKYKLPFDILFDDDFYEKMVIIKEKERLEREERQKVREIEEMKRLMEKYKEEIK